MIVRTTRHISSPPIPQATNCLGCGLASRSPLCVQCDRELSTALATLRQPPTETEIAFQATMAAHLLVKGCIVDHDGDHFTLVPQSDEDWRADQPWPEPTF